MIALSPEPLDVAALIAAVADPDHGATTSFVGTTRREGGLREVAELRYEAYEELAMAEMAAVAAEAQARFGARVAVAHRVGVVGRGRGQRGRGGLRGAPGRRLRGLPPRHRRAEGARADLEADGLRRRRGHLDGRLRRAPARGGPPMTGPARA